MQNSDEPRKRAGRGSGASRVGRVLGQPFHDLRSYSLFALRRDALAGLTVAVVAVPQSLAYAVIAGVPPEIGVYTLIVQSLVGALVGSQPFLSSGPINTQSLLVAAITTRVLAQQELASGQDAAALYLELVVGLTLLKGAIQIGLAGAGFGNLVRYVSGAVILGFTSGAGVLIAVGQLGPFLGVDAALAVGAWPGLAGSVQELGQHLSDIRPASVAIGLGCLGLVVGIRGLWPLAPGPLVAVAAGAAVVAGAGWTQAELPLVPALPSELPGFRLPSLSLARVEPLFGGAFALAVLGLMEAWSIGKTVAAETGQRISAPQELLGQGIANLTSAFFGCMPGSGSFSRTLLNVRAGAVTRYASFFNAGFAAALLLVFAPLAVWIPRASLSAVLFVIAYDLVDWRSISRILRTSRADAAVCLTTFAATLTIPLAYAVFLGVLLNIALYLRQASRLHIAEVVTQTAGREGGRLVERPLDPGDSRNDREVVFLQLQGDLFFGQADELEDRLAALSQSGARVVVIRLKRTLSIDSTVLAVLDRFAKRMTGRAGHMILCGVLPQVEKSLRAYGILRSIGEDCFFEATPGVFASARRALDRAQELAGAEVDLAEFEEQLSLPD